ncbi:DUF333 domain-containing protein [Thiothrix winogradskyi]|jgi:putative hemolysin|uniref:DUF333 domain-containing protein n=1 Tax=Thiothrix winogradskyi TaxID=96472 RepID=A0ABY3STY1_9GAMM|nr:DUF333 domain-containing protein [Thiothrix winogradskyi]UJS22933.1 DUF333 domain-containing protein [Thiothrix winogradskyi]
MKLRMGFIISLMVTLYACSSAPAPINATPQAARAANPASLNCLQNHGRLETHRTPEGERTDCVLPSGKRCDEWEMFRGNCPVRTVNADGIYRLFGL